MYFWWSDGHLGHGNIIRYCKRPFLQPGDLDINGNWVSPEIALERTKQHDFFIIKRFNERVDENDVCFCLGDFCMKKSTEASDAPQNAFDYYRNQLNCKNIIFIKGNHDANNGTKTIIGSIDINFGGRNIHMLHNPKYAKDNYDFNFCGHTHGTEGVFRKLGKKSVIVDLSVDCWNLAPVEINEINQAYSFWKKGGNLE